MIAEMGEERSFPGERRHLGENFRAEVAPLKLALSEIAPLGESNGPSVVCGCGQCATMHEVLRNVLGFNAAMQQNYQTYGGW